MLPSIVGRNLFYMFACGRSLIQCQHVVEAITLLDMLPESTFTCFTFVCNLSNSNDLYMTNLQHIKNRNITSRF